VYENGQKTVTLKGDHIAAEFQALLNQYVERQYG
jgi:(E)-4-hydroxy-3-methylbut-2-enyl-diphosphate synthase